MSKSARRKQAYEYVDRYCPTAGTKREGYARCLEALSMIDTGLHNLRPTGGWDETLFTQSGGINVVIRRELATYDGAELTRLVVAAHRLAVRIAITPVRVAWISEGEDIDPGEVDSWAELPLSTSDELPECVTDPEMIGAGLQLWLWPRSHSTLEMGAWDEQHHPGLDALRRQS